MNEISANEAYMNVIRSQARRGALSPIRRERQMDHLESRLAEDFAGDETMEVLDACCARGRLLHFLNKFDSRHNYLGIDLAEEFIVEGNTQFKGIPNIELRRGNLFELAAEYSNKFDISILYKTLLNFERYEPALTQLAGATRRKIYITSLFFDGDVDFEIKVRQHAIYENAADFAYYNVWGTPRFTSFCRSLGAVDVRFTDMKLDLDLPPSKDGNILTVHTERLESGSRLEVMGAVLMDWKLAEISF